MKKFLEYSLGVFCLLNVATVRAAEKFEVSMGNKFSTYAEICQEG